MLLKWVDWLTYELMGLSADSQFGGSVNFFIYDTVKILALLFGMIYVIGVLRTFILERDIKRWMTRRGLWSYVVAAMMGAFTPFCSCSSIPLFLGFLKAGIPLGVTFAFLVTSPLINEYLVVLMLGFFGWKVTTAYVLSGLAIGVISGVVLGRARMESCLESDFQVRPDAEVENQTYNQFADRLKFGWQEAVSVVRRIWIWVLVGVGLGAVIHNYVPQEMIQSVIQKAGILSVPLAVVLGVPMYGSCAAIVPIAVVLFQKGIPLGTALAFMMAVAALSLPEAVMLRRAMRLPLILLFFAVTTMSIILIGYLLNALQPLLG